MGLFSKKPKKQPAKPMRSPLKKAVAVSERHSGSHPLIACALVLLAALGAVAFVTYQPAQDTLLPWLQPEQTTADSPHNPVGILGATFAMICFQLFGWASALIPVFVVFMAYLCFARRAYCLSLSKFLFMALSLAAGAGVVAQVQSMADRVPTALFPKGLGGTFGDLIYTHCFFPLLGGVGSLTVLVLIYVTALVLVFIPNPGEAMEQWALGILRALRAWWQARRELRQRLRDEKRVAQAEREAAEQAEQERLAQEQARLAAEAERQQQIEEAARMEQEAARCRAEQQQEEASRIAREAAQAAREAAERAEAQQRRQLDRFGPGEAVVVTKAPEGFDTPAPEASAPVSVAPPVATKALPVAKPTPPSSLKIVAPEKVEKAALSKRPERRGDYVFPPLELLDPPKPEEDFPAEDHEARMALLVQKLAEFNLKVFPAEVQTGPVITRYEVQPAEGVRVNRIANLDKDLALGLKATGVRILAPVPGKGTVGIEVANSVARPVCLREIIESRAWADSKAEIPVVLGKDVTGKPIVLDLAKMPHALVAGATGSGKTVCVNSIIASLMYHSTPKDIRFIMVDPKVVEMQVYNQLPHMLIPVVTDPRKVPGALKYLLNEMERRYRLFAKVNVRNLVGFNAKIEKDREKQKEAEALEANLTVEERTAMHEAARQSEDEIDDLPEEKLPYIVLIIDELADLMMTAPADVEPGIARLTAKARAAGIHLIVATQRPSVNVVTGLIKANLPCRIAFKVASNTDSRTILDSPGAEVLLGRGDMLFIPPGSSELVRAQGSFISDDEINNLVAFLRERNGEPDYASDVQEEIDSAAEETDGDDAAEESGNLEDRALRALREQQAAGKSLSVSWLQRRLRLGYNRAARMFEEFEDRGLIRTNGEGKKELVSED